MRQNDLPVIYVYSAAPNGGDGPCFALAEDGVCLGSHWCSHEGFAPGDLGVREGSRPDRHEHYRAHYPGGYRMEFVAHRDLPKHDGIARALELNAAQPSPTAQGDQ